MRVCLFMCLLATGYTILKLANMCLTISYVCLYEEFHW